MGRFGPGPEFENGRSFMIGIGFVRRMVTKSIPILVE